MKLLIINNSNIAEYYFSKQDTQTIITRCNASGKQWSSNLIGFFINITNNSNYAAINIKGSDGVIESMEYVDIDTNKPEFEISNEFLTRLSTRSQQTEITLAEFEPIFIEILTVPVKARRWEVYPAINNHYQLTH